jgi:hypothetical protein
MSRIHYVQVSDQSHAPAVLLPGKSPEGVVRSEHGDEEKNLAPAGDRSLVV